MPISISNIKVENFKSIRNYDFDLAQYTPVVGNNNTGKSNLIKAIKWLIKKQSLPTQDFFNPQQPVIVTAKINGITQPIIDAMPTGQRNSIAPYISNGNITIRRTQTIPGDSMPNIRLSVLEPNNPVETWVPNPNGIDGAFSALLPDPLHLGAMENSEEDVTKNKAGTTIGKLLAEILEDLTLQHEATINNSFQAFKDIFDAQGANRAVELTTFDNSVNQNFDDFFSGISLKVHVPTPEVKEVFNKATIKVFEGAGLISKDVSSLGHGAQRAIQMALVRQLADSRRNNQPNGSTTLLLIDEPELYLHPLAVEQTREALRVLSQNGYQVVFSTHSAQLITQDDIEDVILIRKNQNNETERRRTLRTAISQIQNHDHQLEVLFSLSNSNQILFCDKTILVEGKTEFRLLPFLYKTITGNSIGQSKFSLVKQDGCANLNKSMEVLRVMDIPTKAIVDLDFAFTSAISSGIISDAHPSIVGCKQIFSNIAVQNNIYLNPNSGIPEKAPYGQAPSLKPAQAFEVLAAQPTAIPLIEQLHTDLIQQNIWIWKKGTIETHLGLTGKNNAIWTSFVNTVKQNGLNSINNHQDISDLIGWLNN